MGFSFCRWVVVVLMSAASVAHAGGTLIYNVNGHTMAAGARVDFIAIEYSNGLIDRVYTDEQSVQGSLAEHRIDGKGSTLLPGLIDAHGHISSLGASLRSVDLTGAASETEAAQRVQQFSGDDPAADQSWIQGRGWNQVLWPERQFPDRRSLDAVAPNRPVALSRVDGHAMWVNSKALALAGIDASTPDPEGGQIIRDRSGEPSGVLVDNAMDLVFEAIGVASLEAVEADIVRGLEAAAATGLTSVHDAGVSAQEIQAYRNLQAAGRLPIRVYPMLSVLDPDNDPLLAEGPFRSEDGMLHVRSVKISADGALGSRGAALHRDYSDMPDHTGLLLLSDEELSQHIGRSAQAGFQVNVHAIGDLANTRVLEKFADINQSPKIRAQRHRVEHAQILRPQDINQFAKLDVIASIQPTHATSDKNMAEDRLGASRLEGAYAWNTLLRSQARLAGGSDFPVEPANPLYGLHAAVTRTDREGEPLGGWRPEEKLSRAEALSLFTEWAAYAGHEEEFLGRLAPGFAADFVLVKDDFFAQSEQAIWQNEVLATVVAGKVVYRSAASPM
ncbi:MAG: hypothetical protein RLZZ602_2021 [Pseudomonadota bacterium]